MKYVRILFVLSVSLVLISGTIDLNHLFNYSGQVIPPYITKDNTVDNPVTDIGATLGRVLFYDKNLSVNNTIACASCHQQEYAFSDPAERSTGLNGGFTGRHAMRLVNTRFSDEVRFFWNERAATLEDQTTKPIQDHVEMGFSGTDGDPGIDDLIAKLEGLDYYPALFEQAFGDPAITEERIGMALAQFVRSIQSFDSKFDAGLAMVNNLGAPFPNFTQQENAGKNLFLAPPPGGAGCQGCHRGPEFDIDPNTMNNGIIGVAGYPDSIDLTNTRAPSLRDLFNPDGSENGPFMHDGSKATLLDVINHYDHIVFNPQVNPALDNRLRGAPPGPGQNLNLSDTQKNDLIAFLRTLSGNQIYSEEAYSDPFDADGNIDIIGLTTGTADVSVEDIRLFPNPASVQLTVTGPDETFMVSIYDMQGRMLISQQCAGSSDIDVSELLPGMYVARIFLPEGEVLGTYKFLKVDG